MTNAPDILLLGDPVAQSRSPAFQNAGLRALGSAHTYGVHRCDAAGARVQINRLRRGELRGLNVTAPHKRVAHDAADERTPTCALLGAANTLWRAGDTVWADNTDVAGVEASLDALGADGGVRVVLGAGGAAAAAILAGEAETTVVINRTQERAQALAERLADVRSVRALAWSDTSAVRHAMAAATVIVNATSLALLPAQQAETALDALPWGDVVGALLDLSYAAEPTPFLRRGAATLRRLDGATMLLHQGTAALERWTRQPAPVDAMREALAAALDRPLSTIG